MYKIGLSKIEINCFEKNVGMMGYGMHFNKVKSQKTPLFTRCVAIKDDNTTLIYVCSEIMGISQAIRNEVLSQLKYIDLTKNISENQIMLTAQHTHSAPGGYFHFALYNFSIPGFRPNVFKSIVYSIVEAIKKSLTNLKSMNIKYNSGKFNFEDKIAWNRSISSFNKNPENREYKIDECHKAINPNMDSFSFYDENNNIKGNISWFGIHNTCIGNRNKSIHSDCFGQASKVNEENIGFSIFSQSASGDISPFYNGKGEKIERNKIKREKEYVYCEEKGKKLSKKSLEIINNKNNIKLTESLDSELIYIDMSNIECSKEFTYGKYKAKTSVPCLGVAFFAGTPVDGAGMFAPLKTLANKISLSVKNQDNEQKELYRAHGNKNILMNAQKKSIFNDNKLDEFIVPGALDPTLGELKKQYKNGALKEHSFVPIILAIQIFIIGEIAIIGCPGEITITAGERLKKTVLDKLNKRNIKKVILNSFANSYMGYITTKEEYDVQNYEGGHTLFGQWTLAGFQTKFQELASAMINDSKRKKLDFNLRPVLFSDKEIEKRTYKKL